MPEAGGVGGRAVSDHLKRLREELEAMKALKLPKHARAVVESDDLRALIADYDEMREALQGLEDACASVASWSEECVDYAAPARVTARAVLAKAGGK